MLPKKRTKLSDHAGTFTLNNTLLTIRYWSQSFTTSLFDKNVKDYVLVCQFSLNNFNLEILKNFGAALTYLDIDRKVYVARIKGFVAAITPASVTLQLSLSNIRLKSAYDFEWSTPSKFYEQILSDKQFFKISGKTLEAYVKPLGLLKKMGESDQAFRRRTLEYLSYKIGTSASALSDEEMNQLRENKNDK